jgi:hypothetical protein
MGYWYFVDIWSQFDVKRSFVPICPILKGAHCTKSLFVSLGLLILFKISYIYVSFDYFWPLTTFFSIVYAPMFNNLLFSSSSPIVSSRKLSWLFMMPSALLRFFYDSAFCCMKAVLSPSLTFLVYVLASVIITSIKELISP